LRRIIPSRIHKNPEQNERWTNGEEKACGQYPTENAPQRLINRGLAFGGGILR
jgi:hypothetical protein